MKGGEVSGACVAVGRRGEKLGLLVQKRLMSHVFIRYYRGSRDAGVSRVYISLWLTQIDVKPVYSALMGRVFYHKCTLFSL